MRQHWHRMCIVMAGLYALSFPLGVSTFIISSSPSPNAVSRPGFPSFVEQSSIMLGSTRSGRCRRRSRRLKSALEDMEDGVKSMQGENGVGIKQQNDATQRFQDELEKERAHANAMQFLSEKLQTEKRNKMITALGSVFAAFALFFYQHVHPVEAVTLLRQMQQESPMIQSVVTNGRPTVIDFYAEWCENCKEMAPVLREVEGKYKGKVNFVVINGDSATNADLVDRFRVDGIPHLALISKEGEVKTALIGKVPKQVIEADLDSLLIGQKALPYEGYDAFEDEDHFLRF